MSLPPYSYRNLFEKQKDALRLLGNKQHRVVVYGGGAGGGKSWLGVDWMCGMALNFPDTRWFIGRKELKRIKQTTLVTFYKVAKTKGFTHLFHYNSQESVIKFHNGSELLLLDLNYQPSDPLYERLGSMEFTGGFIEEGGEIHFDAFDTLKSRVGRMNNVEYGIPPKILVTCNPKKNWLYSSVYKPFKEGSLPEDVAFIQSLVTDNPFIGEDYINQLRSLKNESKKQRLLYGNWEYDDNPYALFDYEQLLDCFSSPDRYQGKNCITCDVARLGKDFSIIFVWKGFTVVEIVKIEKGTLDKLRERIVELQKKHNIPNSKVIVDEDGVGGGLVDFGKFRGFVNNSSAIPVKQGDKEKPNYANLKTQCAFAMKDSIEKVRFLPTEFQDSIVEELEIVEETKTDQEGKITISSRKEMKDKLGRSPDFWSAFLMRAYFELVTERKLRGGGYERKRFEVG